MKEVSRCWINVRMKAISLRALSNIMVGSVEMHRRQLGAMTMAKLLASIFVTEDTSAWENIWKRLQELILESIGGLGYVRLDKRKRNHLKRWCYYVVYRDTNYFYELEYQSALLPEENGSDRKEPIDEIREGGGQLRQPFQGPNNTEHILDKGRRGLEIRTIRGTRISKEKRGHGRR